MMGDPVRRRRFLVRTFRSTLLGCLLPVSLSLASCSSMELGEPEDCLARIEPGKTTKKEVLDLLGLPNVIQTLSRGSAREGQRWIYLKGFDWSGTLLFPSRRAPMTSGQVLEDRRDLIVALEFRDDGRVDRLIQPSGK